MARWLVCHSQCMVEIAERLRVSTEMLFLKDLADLAQNLETVQFLILQKDLYEPNDGYPIVHRDIFFSVL